MKTTLLTDMYAEQKNNDLFPILRLAFQCIYQEQGGSRKCSYEHIPENMRVLVTVLRKLAEIQNSEYKDKFLSVCLTKYYDFVKMSWSDYNSEAYKMALLENVMSNIADEDMSFDTVLGRIGTLAFIYYNSNKESLYEIGALTGYNMEYLSKGQAVELCYEIVTVYSDYKW